MASSPDEPLPPAEQDIRWPLVAKLGLGLAVATVIVGIVAALVAAFVVGR